MDDFFKGLVLGFLITVTSLGVTSLIDEYEAQKKLRATLIKEKCADYNSSTGIFKIHNLLENEE